ncbi:hypothetical protein [Brevibacillus centrosporus]|uniref:hypothetical protein n=1 Tax=Brevibacillus centrosporus TaxID=54910 RepID=UPI00381A8CD9
MSFKILILKKLEEMEECLFATNQVQDSTSVSENLNRFIDLFLTVNNQLNVNGHMDNVSVNALAESTEKLSDHLVDLIDSIKNKHEIHFMLIQLVDSFSDWSKLIIQHVKYKLLVLGVNQIALIINQLIDPNKADIVSFIDDCGDYSGKYIGDIEIIDIKEIPQKSFDYIFNVSTNEHIVTNLKRILGNESCIDYVFLKNLILSSPEFTMKNFEFLEAKKNFTGIITGLSYVQKGVNEKLLPGYFVNLANPGQDLFYDFEMFKFAFGHKEIHEQLEHVIIGLSYYSLHYDLSKSSNEARVNYYYPLTQTMHNNKSSQDYLIYHDQLRQIEDKLLQSNHFLHAFELEKNHFQKIIKDSYITQYDCQNRTDKELLDDIMFIKRDYNKDYPETVFENKQILREYLAFLRRNEIKPIIIICPVTKLYQSFTPSKFKQELYEIINELSIEYDFQFLDYYSSGEFFDSDFTDPSHMNNQGAIKLTGCLNRDIIW